MPIYEFVCEECGHEFERIMSFSATEMPACANCGAQQVSRRVGRPAIHFKGSGWYITDSKKSSKESANGTNGRGAKNDEAKSTSEGSAASTKSDSKSGGDSKSTPAADKPS